MADPEKRRIPAFWKAALVLIIAFLFFDNAFPPLMPTSLMIQFMAIIVVGLFLYFSFDDKLWSEFKAPILAVLTKDELRHARLAFLVIVPSIVAYAVYVEVKPSLDAPVELRQVHPAPPSVLQMYGKAYDLARLENPIRAEVLNQLKTNPDTAIKTYEQAIEKGRVIYYQNCLFCHGDLLDGEGLYAKGLNPPPANFRDVGTIAQLQEAYLFWRITTGGPGLPKEGAPWNSAMPVWGEILSEEEVWNVIMFLYDNVGQVPRMWNQDVSRAVTAINEQQQRERTNMDGAALYQFNCSQCHGDEGAGDGPAAQFLYPAPRDFTLGLFKYKSSPFETIPPTDADVFNTIKNGLPGTAMPAWEPLLSDKQIKALIPVIKGLDTTGTWAPEDAPDADFDDEGHYRGQPLSFAAGETTENLIPFTEDSVAKGQEAFEETCAQCHGSDGRGNPDASKRLRDEWGGRIWPRDLTKPWTWRMTEVVDSVDETIRNIFIRLSVGIPGTPMPAHADKLTEDQRWYIANFVYTLRNNSPAISESSVIRALQIDNPLPDDVNDLQWEDAPVSTLLLLPNVIKGERLFKTLSDSLSVRAIYNEENIAFLLELDDRTRSRPGDPDAMRLQDKNLKLYPDAFAIQLPKKDSYVVQAVVQKPLFRHGDAAHPTTIWYWNAGSVVPETPPRTIILESSGVDTKMRPVIGDTNLKAAAQWLNGRWRVLLQRSRLSDSDDDVLFTEGALLPVSFANWDGSNGEAGSKHTLSHWYWLLLPPAPEPAKEFGLPFLAWLITFFAGFFIMRRTRPASGII